MPPSTDLPPWLGQPRRRPGTGPPGRGGAGRGVLTAMVALLLLAAGGGAGYWVALRRPAPVAATPPAVVCPPPVVCLAPAAAGGRRATVGVARPPRHPKHPPAALVPLPAATPLEDAQRTKALRAFAAQRAPELRDCLSDPDRGPQQELGAAFEIDAHGAVEEVQILGADAATRGVRRCYASRLKKWRFPTDLLRGEEKLLVNFVL